MVRVERNYAFEGPDGRRSLPELFDGRSQLIKGWPRAPQSFWFRRHDEFDEPPPSARLGIDAAS